MEKGMEKVTFINRFSSSSFKEPFIPLFMFILGDSFLFKNLLSQDINTNQKTVQLGQ